MPFDPLKDSPDTAPPKRVNIVDDQGQLLDGTVRGMVWSTASLAWIREQQAVVNTDNLTVSVGMPTVSVGNIPAVTQSGAPWSTVGSVWVSAMPTVSVGNIAAVTQSGTWGVTATVNLAGIPTVSVGTPTVSVGNTVNVSVLTAPLDVQQTGGTPWGIVGSVNVGNSLNLAFVPTLAVGSVPTIVASVWGTGADPDIGGALQELLEMTRANMALLKIIAEDLTNQTYDIEDLGESS